MNKNLVVYSTSDMHRDLIDPDTIPPCDIFIVAGDSCPWTMSHDIITQSVWLGTVFRPWLKEVKKKAEYEDDDLFHHHTMPHCTFTPTYKTTIEVLVGEKVRVYEFRSPHGEFTERDATLKEYKTGLAFKKAQDEQQSTHIG